jgi:hypothetical protein
MARPLDLDSATGVRPRRPPVRPFGGLKPCPDSSSKTSQAPYSATAPL